MQSRIANPANSLLYLRVITFFGAVSLVMSIILFAEHYSDDEKSFCDLNDMFSSLLGVIWNVIAIIAGLQAMTTNKTRRPNQGNYFTTFLFFWCLVGCVFIVYLFIGEISVGSFCPLCTVVHFCTIIMTYMAYKLFKRQPPLVFIDAFEELRYIIILMFILFGVAVLRYNLHTAAPDPLLNQIFPVSLSTEADKKSDGNAKSAVAADGDGVDKEKKAAEEPIEFVDTFDEVAKCLTERGWIFFGLDNCHHCQYQKRIFGSAMKNIKFIECRRNPKTCLKHDIQSFPAWVRKIKKKEVQRIIGVQVPNYLASITKPACPQSKQKITAEPLEH